MTITILILWVLSFPFYTHLILKVINLFKEYGNGKWNRIVLCLLVAMGVSFFGATQSAVSMYILSLTS